MKRRGEDWLLHIVLKMNPVYVWTLRMRDSYISNQSIQNKEEEVSAGIFQVSE